MKNPMFALILSFCASTAYAHQEDRSHHVPQMYVPLMNEMINMGLLRSDNWGDREFWRDRERDNRRSRDIEEGCSHKHDGKCYDDHDKYRR